MAIIKLDDFPLNPQQGQIYEIIPDKTKIVASTNRLFNKYPTRYISAVPRFAIAAYSQADDTVLDPFCGSGTTAIEAMLMGRNAVSIDISAFARLLIKVKTTKYSTEDFAFLENAVTELKKLAPVAVNESTVPQIPNIQKWFCERSVLWLSNFKAAIDGVCDANERIRDYLYVVLAAIIRKVSNAEEVSPKPYVSTRYPKQPGDARELFFRTEELYRSAITDFSASTENFNCTSRILPANDARKIDKNVSVELAVTSPPYINAYDYVRSLRFEELWLGLTSAEELSDNRKSYVGTEVSSSFYSQVKYARQSQTLAPIIDKIAEVDKRRANIVETYFEDMALNMLSVRGALKQGGRYAIVVGDSTIRGQSIPTAKILAEIAGQNGYSFEVSFKYVIRDRYLHLPRGERGGIIKYDEILVIIKK